MIVLVCAAVGFLMGGFAGAAIGILVGAAICALVIMAS